ncbi:MAG: alpha/beta hydrolase, partial [Solirubrobacteraceae bacterium]|nr:alpha/beta hydrolase [Solirubrobacteraceae bacterium]
VGHDWGGWVGFLLGLRAPERIERYLALNIPPPFMEPRYDLASLLALPRLSYQLVMASPLGPVLHRTGLTKRLLTLGLTDPKLMTDEERDIFDGPFREPARARAAQLMYREFVFRELGPVMAGRYRKQRLTVPTFLLFGEEDVALDPQLLEGAEAFCDDLTVELVPGAGHFIVDERPDLVIEKIGSFLG